MATLGAVKATSLFPFLCFDDYCQPLKVTAYPFARSLSSLQLTTGSVIWQSKALALAQAHFHSLCADRVGNWQSQTMNWKCADNDSLCSALLHISLIVSPRDIFGSLSLLTLAAVHL